jgi:hypothetical protein
MRDMERCPDKETLERFVDYGLTEEMNENILSHMAICDSCREKVGCLLSEERGLLKTLFTEPVNHKQAMASPEGRCLSKAALLAYAGKSLNEDQRKLVELHLQECNKCMFELLAVQRSINLSADLNLDMQTMRTMHGVGPHVLEIVLRVKDSLVELIRHTGELLSLTPQLSAVRGAEEKEEKPIVIRKDFQERDLSVEVTINKELVNSEGALRVSLMRLGTEEFLARINVELTGPATHRQDITDEDGIVEFSGIRTGTYDITIGGEITVIIAVE